ncbi:hypothetical protein AURDEDRAFT_175506 [Auricularia subglabra TFB-10046 SS5]|uniref:Uncharacterized protein n=1 Tax=Auricularia subglabra (strain TFB-10046 / SS5) TaxID=717982 RepID=J0LET2_AURST|nr:hypothetical protein AURDEDRAFT_175506 [Auricularia subglabra TFB-10046 SS5]
MSASGEILYSLLPGHDNDVLDAQRLFLFPSPRATAAAVPQKHADTPHVTFVPETLGARDAG